MMIILKGIYNYTVSTGMVSYFNSLKMLLSEAFKMSSSCDTCLKDQVQSTLHQNGVKM